MAELASETLRKQQQYEAALADAREKERRSQAAKPADGRSGDRPGEALSRKVREDAAANAGVRNAPQVATIAKPPAQAVAAKPPAKAVPTPVKAASASKPPSVGRLQGARPPAKTAEAAKPAKPRPASGLQGVRVGSNKGNGKAETAAAAEPEKKSSTHRPPSPPAKKTGLSAKAKEALGAGVDELTSRLTGRRSTAFQDAFAKARKAGDKEFTFNGKKYHTRRKGEGDGKAAGGAKDARYTTPPFVNKSGTGGGGVNKPGESRAAKVKRLNEKARQVNAAHRASRGKSPRLSESTADDFRKRRGERVDRRK